MASMTGTGTSETGTTRGAGTTGGRQAESDSGTRGRAADAYRNAREKTYSAYESARGRAADVTRQAGDQIAVYPMAAVVGGLALGALIGWLIPATRREQELLAPTGRRITDAAKTAAQRGIDAGKEQVEEIRSRAAQKVGEAVVEAVGSVAKD